MNRISGRILDAAGKLGISDVIVVLYDVDAAEATKNFQTGSPTSGTVVRTSDDDDQDTSQDPNASPIAQAYLNLIYGGKDSEEDPALSKSGAQPRADRLGSVVTGRTGEFSFEFSDDAFRVNDQEQRPDLLLMVIAPDRPFTSSENSALSLGTPEIARIIHMSFGIARNIGRQEELIIQVDNSILKKWGIGPQAQATGPGHFAASVAAAKKQEQRTNAILSSRLEYASTVKSNRVQKEKASKFTSQLSSVPKKQRSDQFFVSKKSDLQTVETASKEAALANLQGYTSEANLVRPAATLRLTSSYLDQIGASFEPSIGNGLEGIRDALAAGQSVNLRADPDRFCASLLAKNGGPVLEAISERFSSDPDAGQVDETIEETETAPQDETGNGTNVLNAIESTEEFIRRMVLARVKSLGSDLSDEREQNQSERILDKIQTLHPPASPADVPAYHDFTHLQIAFPNIWEEAFDRKLKSLMEELHVNYQDEELAVANETSIFGLDEIDKNELDDLREYTELMESLGADVERLHKSTPIPDEVREFYTVDTEFETSRVLFLESVQLVKRIDEISVSATDLLEKNWHKLSTQQQREIFDLASAADPFDAIPVGLVNSNAEGDEDPRRRIFDKVITTADANSLDSVVKLSSLVDESSNDVTPEIQAWRARRTRATEILSNPRGRVTRVQKLLTEIAQRTSEPHSFQVFAEDSVNYGIMTTYRQKWTPQSYQVGDLVSTMPLAPGQSLKYSKKESTKKTLSQKQNENFASTIKDERQITSRAISDIVDKANTQTNFQSTVQTQSEAGLFGIAGFSANTTTQFQRNQNVESQRVKKQFREAVRKASQEYKNERSVSIESETISEFENTESSEISNPNNEITVTYLFYELERQYRVSEHLHRLTPVIMIAQEVPDPSEIDEDFLLANDWILRRVLLDRNLEDALDYLSEGLVADEVILETRREAYETQQSLVEELAENVESLASTQATLRDSLVQTSQREKLARVARKRAKRRRRRGIFKKIFMPLPVPGVGAKIASGTSGLGFGARGEDPEALEAQREALETRLGFIEENLEDGRARLTRANSALENATDELSAAIEDSFTKRNLVNQLRIHVKENILYYMQMIWTYEPTDQRFFRLYGIEVPEFEPENIASAEGAATTKQFEAKILSLPLEKQLEFLGRGIAGQLKEGDRFMGIQIPPPVKEKTKKRRCHEICDLDNPLGFKGNYMIFPLKECTYLTDFMMQDYVDEYFGIRDPDPAGQISTKELLSVTEDLLNDDAVSDAEKEAIKNVVQARLTSPRLEEELIVVPTGQLFIEALKGEHALLEDFKRKHRALDVIKVNEEVREMQLENLRRAALMLSDTPDLSDPDIDKKISISGLDNVSVETE